MGIDGTVPGELNGHIAYQLLPHNYTNNRRNFVTEGPWNEALSAIKS